MNSEEYTGFEQGPIRPPSEAESLLIRITRNCPWNKCTFCAVYKDSTFSRRPVEHVLKDIDTVHAYVQAILAAQKRDGSVAYDDFMRLLGEGEVDRMALYAARSFIAGGMRSIFLQDGNSLIIRPDDLVRILEYLRRAFPHVDRVTSYARAKTVSRISDQDLARIARAGLNRIHIGMESGADKVLAMVRKGVDKASQIVAGQKVKKAGMELSEYYMPGLGGRALSRENALETADAMNRINPDFIRLRTLALPDGAPLARQAREGGFDKMGDVETARELLLFLESLHGVTSTVKSDHVLNLFPEVEGELPEDKEKITAPIKEFLALSPHEQMLFSLGRRHHCMAEIGDLRNPMLRRNAERISRDLGVTVENVDRVVDGIMKRFI